MKIAKIAGFYDNGEFVYLNFYQDSFGDWFSRISNVNYPPTLFWDNDTAIKTLEISKVNNVKYTNIKYYKKPNLDNAIIVDIDINPLDLNHMTEDRQKEYLHHKLKHGNL